MFRGYTPNSYGRKYGTIPYLHQLDPGDLPLKNGGSWPWDFSMGFRRFNQPEEALERFTKPLPSGYDCYIAMV